MELRSTSWVVDRRERTQIEAALGLIGTKAALPIAGGRREEPRGNDTPELGFGNGGPDHHPVGWVATRGREVVSSASVRGRRIRTGSKGRRDHGTRREFPINGRSKPKPGAESNTQTNAPSKFASDGLGLRPPRTKPMRGGAPSVNRPKSSVDGGCAVGVAVNSHQCAIRPGTLPLFTPTSRADHPEHSPQAYSPAFAPLNVLSPPGRSLP